MHSPRINPQERRTVCEGGWRQKVRSQARNGRVRILRYPRLLMVAETEPYLRAAVVGAFKAIWLAKSDNNVLVN